MRFLLFFFITVTGFAQTSPVEQQIKDLVDGREKALADWRELNKFQKLPNAEYVKLYQEIWGRYAQEEEKVYKDACEKDKAACLTPQKLAEIQTATRIARDVIVVQNAWAEQGKTEDEQKAAADTYKRCVTENKDCDKLSKEDQEKAKATRGPASEEPKKDDPKIDPDFDTKKKQIHDDLIKMSADMDAEFAKTHPDWDKKEMTEEVKAFLISKEDKFLEEALKKMQELCKDNKEQPACSEGALAGLKDTIEGNKCKIERRFQINSLVGDKAALKKKLDDNHVKEWEGLAAPKSCQVLLDQDKKPVIDTDSGETTPEEEDSVTDEKTPRNYKPETCKWVTDIPRKIVNGPGCSAKAPNRVCTGYVVCEQKQGGAKFVRMSTCRPEFCGSKDEDAVKCTKDLRYFSQKPKSEDKLFVTPKLKKILDGSGSVQ